MAWSCSLEATLWRKKITAPVVALTITPVSNSV
jgi:hypothetical protein